MSDLSTSQMYYETRELCHRDVYKHLTDLRNSLTELKCISKKALLDNTLFWQKEVEKTKEQKDQEWLIKVSLAEAENKQLRSIIQRLAKENGYKYTSDQHLWEVESEVEKLNRLLDAKLIHINQLQIALAEQSKEMFKLERTCALCCYQYKSLLHKENCKSRKILESKSQASQDSPS